MLPTLPILRYDSLINMTATRLLSKPLPALTQALKQAGTPHSSIESLVPKQNPSPFFQRIDSIAQENPTLIPDEIYKGDLKKAIADIVNQTTSLSDNDQLMQLMELANFISQLSDEEIINLLSERPTE
ncbi:hypothetical protein N9L24_03675 [Candidatus Marinamargulisbacteria bacterium]|nr:hypothetical protein [Candidatus Marinamargulisbacteria bacterium]